MAVARMVFASRDFTMKIARSKLSRMRNTVFILVTTVSVFAFFQLGNFTALKDLLQDENLKHIEYWSHEVGQAALREGEQLEATRLPHRGGWAVEAGCREGIDVLFFVHACSREWRRRAVLRDTLVEEAAARRFNWAAVFFVGRRCKDPLLDAWLNLEADALGDLVVFPFEDGYRTVTPKWVAGMQWVADHCPNVPVIVKLDDDVTVHPFKLSQYIQTEFPREPARLHCYVSVGQPVDREPGIRFFVRTDDAPMEVYFNYCSGQAVIMTFNVMRTLLRASPKVHPHPTDDAYVTGDLALLQGIGHVDIGRLYFYEPSRESNGSCLFVGDCIFMHWQVVAGGKAIEEVARTLDARFYWSVLLSDRKVHAGVRLDLSCRLKSRDYALAFQETRAVLIKRNRIDKAQQAPLPSP
ncbi:N-acetyllactosaminide beta-1,3-N-acetylglucosaminyltransferase 3-like [Haemaphysalis longicornis]